MGRPKSIINQTREQMKALGVYKPEFEPIIEVYSQLREQYKVLTERFIASDYNFKEYTNTGTKKAPIVTTLESLRKDILAYAAQLGLTPQGLLKTDDKAFAKKKQSILTTALKGLDNE
ncbi:MAG TPA: P27 family phage terminase small subunit [Peptococcaceae bacterium]|nr:P27 family phage terminase small subunit [Peptococcaceae bacterium]